MKGVPGRRSLGVDGLLVGRGRRGHGCSIFCIEGVGSLLAWCCRGDGHFATLVGLFSLHEVVSVGWERLFFSLWFLSCQERR